MDATTAADRLDRLARLEQDYAGPRGGEACTAVETVDGRTEDPYLLRRCAELFVPALAVATVTVEANTSVVADEILAKRVSLLPFVWRDDRVDATALWKTVQLRRRLAASLAPPPPPSGAFFADAPAKLSQTRCAEDTAAEVLAGLTGKQLKGRLHYGHPEHARGTGVVTSADVEMEAPLAEYATPWRAARAGTALDRGLELVRLAPGQRVHLTFTVRAGCPDEHAKFKSVCSFQIRRPLRVRGPPACLAKTEFWEHLAVRLPPGAVCAAECRLASPWAVPNEQQLHDAVRAVVKDFTGASDVVAEVDTAEPRYELHVATNEALDGSDVLRLARRILQDVGLTNRRRPVDPTEDDNQDPYFFDD